ncbi:hypothetical protein Mgra_00008091 [Meloidogyne graminicola]|uniref:C-type lectin domain-containing protein n=1 Tax=Meloidogyne graminicola TaxID=189291 RepID=A0A8S9ZGN9_9BILA|nr:hypothetical protein Mgra_00008091 [Meloidogyne graminicola]
MYLITLLIIFLIFPSFVSSKCSSEWKTRVDSDGNTYGYIALISDLINIFQANAICREKGGDIVSIHSEEENNFVGALASPLIKQCQETNACVQRVNHNNNGTTLLDKLYRSLWIGTARVQFAPPFGNTSVQCVNTDGTPCDYGRVDGLAAHNRNITPWGFGNPSGLSDFSERSIEGCTELYIGSNSPQPYWNDISCYALLGGVVCKKNCSQTCKDEDMETTTTTKTLTTTTQVNNICNNTVCGVDGWKWHCNEKKTQCMSYHKYTMPSNGTYWDVSSCIFLLRNSCYFNNFYAINHFFYLGWCNMP